MKSEKAKGTKKSYRLYIFAAFLAVIMALSCVAIFAADSDDVAATGDNEAKIGTVEYPTLVEAINAATNGQTVTLLKDVTDGDMITVNKGITIDLGGYTWSVNKEKGSVVKITTIAADGEVEIKNGSMAVIGAEVLASGSEDVDAIWITGTANVTLTNLNVTVETNVGACVYAGAVSTSVVTIDGGVYKNISSERYLYSADGAPLTINIGNGGSATVLVKSGEFVGRNPELGDDSGTPSSFLSSEARVCLEITEERNLFFPHLSSAMAATTKALIGTTTEITYILLQNDVDVSIARISDANLIDSKDFTDKLTVNLNLNAKTYTASVMDGTQVKTKSIDVYPGQTWNVANGTIATSVSDIAADANNTISYQLIQSYGILNLTNVTIDMSSVSHDASNKVAAIFVIAGTTTIGTGTTITMASGDVAAMTAAMLYDNGTEQNYLTNKPTLNVNGATINGDLICGVTDWRNNEDNTGSYINLVISSGTVNGAISMQKIHRNGGVAEVTLERCVIMLDDDVEGTHTVSAPTSVAKDGSGFVMYYGSFDVAIDAADTGSVIQLGIDTTVNTVTFNGGKTLTFDINGHNLTVTGEIQASGAGTRLILIDSVGTGLVSSTGYLLNVYAGATMQIDSGNYHSVEMTVFAEGNSTGTATLIINGGTFTADDNAVVGTHGGDGRGYYAITINGGTFNGNISASGYVACGIYAANNGTVTVNDGTFNITKGAGIVARGGTVTVTGGTFNCTGTETGKVGDSRVVVKCSPIVADYESNYPGLLADSAFTVTGGTFSAVDDIVEYLLNADKGTAPVISGGFFNKAPAADYIAEGKAAVYNMSTSMYEIVDVFTITISDGIQHGAVEASATSAVEGTEITLTVIPTTGYRLKEGTLVVTGTGGDVTVTDDKFTMPAYNVTVTAEFELIPYTVTYEVTNGESIVDGTAYYHAAFESVTITPNEHYVLPDSVTVTMGGAPFTQFTYAGGKVTIAADKIEGNLVITAVCVKETYAITLAVDGEGYGTITPTSIVNQPYGATYTVNGATLTVGGNAIVATPTDDDEQYDYNFIGWYIGDTPVSASYISGAMTFTAKFTRTAVEYTVTVDAEIQNGTVEASATSAAVGTEITLTVTPAEGYVLASLFYTAEGSATPVAIVNNTFDMPAANVTVTAVFEGAVAKIGTTYYTSLADAIAAAQTNDNIVLLANITVDSEIVISKKVTISGEFTIAASDSFAVVSKNALIYVNSTGDLTINGPTVNANGKARAILNESGILTLAAGTVTGGYTTSYVAGIYNTGTAHFYMTGGEVSGNVISGTYAADNYLQYSADLWSGSQVIASLTGGTVANLFINANSFSMTEAGTTINGATVTNVYVEYDTGNVAQLVYTDGTITKLMISKAVEGESVIVVAVKGTSYKGGVSDVIWKNGTETLETDSNVAYNSAPTYNGEQPTKESTEQYVYTFLGWNSDPAATEPLASLPAVTGDVTYYAVFSQQVREYTVTLTNGTGVTGYTYHIGSGSETDYTAAFQVEYGKSLSITAVIAEGYDFNGWSVISYPAINPVVIDSVTSDISVSALTVEMFTITLATGGEGSGTISPTSIDAQPSGTTYSADGTTLTIGIDHVVATPAAATEQYTYGFDGWYIGDTKVTEGGTISGATTFTAKFTRTVVTYAITLETGGEGSGTISPTSIGAQAYGTEYSVTDNVLTIGETAITATPAADTAQYTYAFDGWYIGENKITAASTITGATTFTAKFTRTPVVYAVSIDPNIQNGTVIAAPTSGAAGTEVTLTITPDDGYRLKEGSLVVTGTGGAVTVTNNKFEIPAYDVTVTAEFELIPPTVYSVNIGALTNGEIVASPTSGAAGTEITLTITPASGYQLKAGSLSVTGTAGAVAVNDNKFTMPESDVTVTAEFEEIPPVLYYAYVNANNGTTDKSEAMEINPATTPTVTLPAASAFSQWTKTGYHMVGYSTTATGAKELDFGQSVPVADVIAIADANNNVNIYIVWEIETYTVTFSVDGNGTVDTTTVANVPYGSAFTVSDNTVTINGTTVTVTVGADVEKYTYSFGGWNIKNGDTVAGDTAVVATVVEITKPETTETAVEFISDSDDKTVTASVDDIKSSDKENVVIGKDVESASDAANWTVEIPKSYFSDKTENVSVTVTDVSADLPDVISDDQKKKLEGMTVISLDMIIGEKTEHQFGTKVTVKLAYTLKAGQSADNLFVYYVNTESGQLEKYDVTYADGFITFETDHFSFWAVGEDIGSSSPVNDGLFLASLLVAAIILPIIAGLVIFRKK